MHQSFSLFLIFKKFYGTIALSEAIDQPAVEKIRTLQIQPPVTCASLAGMLSTLYYIVITCLLNVNVCLFTILNIAIVAQLLWQKRLFSQLRKITNPSFVQ
jgi:hypothetical protein